MSSRVRVWSSCTSVEPTLECDGTRGRTFQWHAVAPYAYCSDLYRQTPGSRRCHSLMTSKAGSW